ncbi:MAG: ABC transporter ATP-binding protein, partial [bacterium]
MAEIILEARDIFFKYEEDSPILRDVNFSLTSGETVAIQGPSGEGKTTLLEIMGTMRKPDRGKIVLGGENVYQKNAGERARLRGQWLGFVFQESLLMPDLTAWENCRLAVVLSNRNWPVEKIRDRFKELMEALGLSLEKGESRPSQLSSGERQRVAVVRGLMHNPALLVADEPTGNLDRKASDRLMDLLKPLARSNRTG